MSAALPELEVISIEWPDEDTPCSNEVCGRAAVWWWDCTCGYTGYACQQHREHDDRAVSRVLARGQRMKCNRCQRRVPLPLAWHPLR